MRQNIPGFEPARSTGLIDGLVTREDVLRARDRRRVLNSRSARRHWHLLWLLLGPGVLVMLG
ncbi:MAG: hypothetical protein ACREE5_00990, partial [Acetobacteraceae bacterium]